MNPITTLNLLNPIIDKYIPLKKLPRKEVQASIKAMDNIWDKKIKQQTWKGIKQIINIKKKDNKQPNG